MNAEPAASGYSPAGAAGSCLSRNVRLEKTDGDGGGIDATEDPMTTCGE